ncbi:unnamed protein product [Larinioides sclopetarius]|uniref:Uncharacterized protein n=1 Tax=Larinioides sclopetarius TaxID=280406 RepID=A0AAV2A9C3_9ARAC
MTIESLKMNSIEELKLVVHQQEDTIQQMNSLLLEREEEIRELRSLLDKYQSVFPVVSPHRYSRSARRKERAQGISAEPPRLLNNIQELIQTKYQEYPKSDSVEEDDKSFTDHGGWAFKLRSSILNER